MGDFLSPDENQTLKLADRLKLEKGNTFYADIPSELVKDGESTTSRPRQRRHLGSRALENEEIVKYMSNLPSYLERGKHFQDKALNFGVMDWGRLEKWQYNHKYAPSSSNSSPYFSTNPPSTRSSRGRSWSPTQKSQRRTLQSHLNIPPIQNFSSTNKGKKSNNAPDNDWGGQGTTLGATQPLQKNKDKMKLNECTGEDMDSQVVPDTESSINLEKAQKKSSAKGKMKVEDPCEKHETVFPFPSDAQKAGVIIHENPRRMSFSENPHFEGIYNSDIYDNIPRSCPLQSEVANGEQSRTLPNSPNSSDGKYALNPSKEKRSTMSADYSGIKMSPVASTKVRNISPLRRLSIGLSKIGRGSNRDETSVVPDNLAKENQNGSSRARSSPLRRLLDPVFSSRTSKSELSLEDTKTKVKGKLDLRSSKETRMDDSHRNVESQSSTIQALFQVAVKNGRQLFTFAVESNSNILAATVRRLTSSGKQGDSWIYTFFTVHQGKKKHGNWLNQGSKGKSQDYIPNIAAQMKVSEQFSIREFVLFGVELSQLDNEIPTVKPHDELGAIVVKFPRKAIEGECGHFSTTVILPGGDHGVPTKGELPPLIERWLSGGLCDCGGWDVGCRLRVLKNESQARKKPPSNKVQSATGHFELYHQGEELDEKPFFCMSSMRENIYSVEFDSSLSELQAFSVCVSAFDSRQPSHLPENSHFPEKSSEENNTQNKSSTDVVNQRQEEINVIYASYPPLSPAGRV